MNADRWAEVERLYHAASARPAGERAAYVAETCAGDEALRREVESLLAQAASIDGPLDAGALAAAARLASSASPLTGRRIGVYQVLAPLGASGMGEVYRARDTKLGREVAIKILPRAFTRDPERLTRFEREARVLATLNHPHIGAIYGFEDNDGVPALVLELVDGPTLADRIARGPLPVTEALAIARQMADALDAAHEKGIVHRDLKPANVKITPEGVVKVLDFGLAKAGSGATADVTQSPTMTVGGTRDGVILGTAAYMSPEQARGLPVDKRTDIWAFGCVLYEMLTGHIAFSGKTVADTIARVLEREPDWQALPRETPVWVRELLRRCLSKDSAVRLRDIGEVRIAIAGQTRAGSVPPIGWRGALVTLGLGAAALAGWANWPSPDGNLGQLRYTRLTNFPDAVHSPAMSPDGRMLAFVRGRDPFLFGAGEVYVKVLPDGQPVALTRDGTPKMAPTFTPDGASVVYTNSASRWSSFSVPASGGAPTLFMPNAAGLRWIGSGQVLFSEMRTPPNMSVVTATDSRGSARDVYAPKSPQGMAHFTERSPDGRWVLVVEMDTNAWMPCRVVPFDGSSAGRQVGPPRAECTSATWSPDGRWMYFAAGVNNESHLWRQRFPDGAPEQLTSGTSQERGVVLDRDGRSVITAVGASQSVVWYHDEAGDRPVSIEGYAYRPLVSPDGSRVFYLIRREARRSFSIGELWATDLMTGRNERILEEFLVRSYDVSRDGKTVVFDTFDETDRSRMWLAPTDRSAAPRRLTPDGLVEEQRPFFASSGDIYFMREEPSRRPSLYRMSPDGSERQKKSDDVTFLISVSPDGHWAAVWDGGVTRLLSLVDGASRTLCSCSTGPIFPDSPRVRWSGDGQTLFVNLGYADDPGGGTVTIPWRGADSVAAGVLLAPADLRKRAGTRLLGESSVAPGPTSVKYAFARQAEQSNLYRIHLP